MFERVTTTSGFQALKRDWDQLYQAAGVSNPFVSHAWLSAWSAHVARRFAALCIRPAPGAPLDAAVMFATDHRDRWCYITEHSYRPGLLARPGAVYPLRALIGYIFTHEPWVWRVGLHRCPDTDGFYRALMRELGPLRPLCVPEEVSVPERVIDVSGSFDDYLAARASKKIRQELRRKLRQIVRRMPAVAFDELAGVSGGEALDIITHVERDSWKVDARTAIISNQRERDFYRAVFEISDVRTRGRMFTLSGPEGTFAYGLGVQHDDTYYALKTSYRADHARLAPGQALFAYLIRHMCEHEPTVATIELLGTDSRWKRELASYTRDERGYDVMRPDPVGISYALVKGHLRPALKRAAVRDPRVARLIEVSKRVRAGVGSVLSRSDEHERSGN